MLDFVSSVTTAAQFAWTHDGRRRSRVRRRSIGQMTAIAGTLLLCMAFSLPSKGFADPSPQTIESRVATALENITLLQRPGQMGFATVWDGNKYVQCGRGPDGSLRCEAAGTLMQPSLEHVLVPEKIERLGALGWRLDPSFGNYVQIFPGVMPTSGVAVAIVQVLAEAYNAQVAVLDVETHWVASEPCPPRNGPSQNLAGVINDASIMASTAVHSCSYAGAAGLRPNRLAAAAETLIAKYGRRVTGEIQRLRVNGNSERRVYFVLDVQIGYVQCGPQSAPAAIYCEAQSAENWPPIAAVLTPGRLARLHAAGFVDPGRAANYWKIYPLDQFDDATIAGELLTILHEVYGYDGSWDMEVKTE